MLFTLEAVFAKHGDALILHYGPSDDPSWVLVDGGPPGVYGRYLRPRLEQLRSDWCAQAEDSLPLELVMVSHIDEDHITGILDLYDEELSADGDRRPLPFAIRGLWHNGFDELAGPAAAEVAALLREGGDDASDAAVVASVGQGVALRRATERLGTGGLNPGFADLVLAQGPGKEPVDLGHGLRFRVLCPSAARIEAFRLVWEKWLAAVRAKEKSAAEVAAMEDTSPTNLASIVVLAEMGGRTMLLTGDARGDDVLAGLDAAGILRAGDQPLVVDLLKMPHHGSSRNVDEGFLARVLADHYVFSADGRHGNPDPQTLRMLAAARGADEYTLHLTLTQEALDDATDHARQRHLGQLRTWLEQERPPGCHVVFRSPTESSIRVDLGDDRVPAPGTS